MAELKLFNGGEFLITDALPEEIFTPEDFSKEHRLIGKSAEEFALGEIEPRREELEELNPELIKILLRKAGELGFLSTDIPEIYGGAELDHISCVLVAERLTRGISAFDISSGVQTGIGSLPIVFFGSPEQKAKYLPKLCTGEVIGAFALTEPEHGSDALTAETTAVLSEDGKYYILNGQKQLLISFSPMPKLMGLNLLVLLLRGHGMGSQWTRRKKRWAYMVPLLDLSSSRMSRYRLKISWER